MKVVLMLLVAVMLAGCAQDKESTPSEADPVDIPAGNETLPPINVTTPSHVRTTVVNETITIAANTCNPAGQMEDLLFQIMLPNDTKDFTASFERVQQPQRLFATNIRMYEPGNSNVGNPDEQSAWDGNGMMTFSVDAPAGGMWTFTLLHCDVPQGNHVVAATMVATLPADAAGA